jgi:hypothetical protein
VFWESLHDLVEFIDFLLLNRAVSGKRRIYNFTLIFGSNFEKYLQYT